MRNDFSRPTLLWTDASVPNARDISIWDRNQYQGLDGDNGGTWAPETPIGIGGEGLQLASGSQMLGGFESRLGGRFVLGTADFPAFSTPQSRTETFAIRGINGTGVAGLTPSVGIEYRVAAKTLLTSGRGAVLRSGWTNPQAPLIYFPIPARYIHAGATISSVVLYAFLSQPPANTGFIEQLQLLSATSSTNYAPPQTFWQASHTYAGGVTIIPSGFTRQNGLYFTSSGSGGTTGSTQPTWNLILGGGTFDGSVNWITAGNAGTLVMPSSYSNAALYNGGAIYALKLTPFPASSPLVATKGGDYVIAINQDANPWVYTACQINYTAIADFRFQ